MTAPRPTLPRRLFAGLALVLLGLVSWALYGIQAGSENRSFHPTDTPPRYVRVVAGHTYWLAVPGGIDRIQEAGRDPAALTCTAAARGRAPGALQVTPVVGAAGDETKFVNRIASFVAAGSGRLHVECAGIGAPYVENAADAGFDWSGFWLVLAGAALAVGLPLTLSGLRRPASAGRDGLPAEPEPAES